MTGNGFMPRTGPAIAGAPHHVRTPSQGGEALPVPSQGGEALPVWALVRPAPPPSADEPHPMPLRQRIAAETGPAPAASSSRVRDQPAASRPLSACQDGKIPRPGEAALKEAIKQRVMSAAPRQVELLAREWLAGESLGRLLAPLESSAAPLAANEFHAMCSMAIRCAVACQKEPSVARWIPSDMPSKLAVERVKYAISKLSAHLVDHRVSSAMFGPVEVAALVKGALSHEDGVPLVGVEQVRNLSALLQGLLPSAPVSRPMLSHVRQALTTQALLDPSASPLRCLQYLSRVLVRWLAALGERPPVPLAVLDWESLLRSASRTTLRRLGPLLADAVATWPEHRVQALVHEWVSRWHGTCGAEPRPRKGLVVDPVDTVDTLALLLRNVPPNCGASPIAALVQGWSAAVPSGHRERAARLLRDPNARELLAMTQAEFRARDQFADNQRRVVLAALNPASREDMAKPIPAPLAAFPAPERNSTETRPLDPPPQASSVFGVRAVRSWRDVDHKHIDAQGQDRQVPSTPPPTWAASQGKHLTPVAVDRSVHHDFGSAYPVSPEVMGTREGGRLLEHKGKRAERQRTPQPPVALTAGSSSSADAPPPQTPTPSRTTRVPARARPIVFS
jgi:hypothetical protein